MEAARRVLQAAENAVRKGAVRVLAAEHNCLADELRATREVVRDLESRLRAAGRLPNSENFAPLRPSLAVAHEEPPQFAPSWNPESVALSRMRVYLDALERDAEATWDSVEEPAVAAAAPQVVFRPSTAGADAAAA